MGKSSLLNLLVPDAQAATREISEALQTGKHTTTDARLYDLPEGSGKIIDTPGFQEFGLAHLSPGQIERAFPELRPYLGQCRFYNCSHLMEPGCAIRDALEKGAIPASRYALFSALTRESATTAR
jgi:ribosome biogenesis GTPase